MALLLIRAPVAWRSVNMTPTVVNLHSQNLFVDRYFPFISRARARFAFKPPRPAGVFWLTLIYYGLHGIAIRIFRIYNAKCRI
jgi:hypothetical protein